MFYSQSRFTIACLVALIGATVLPKPVFAADDAKGEDKHASQLDSEIESLKKVAGNNPCRQAFLIAIQDAKVRALFLRKLRNECYLLRDICCLQMPSIPEQASVLFNFDCSPRCACLLDPQFLVIVNKIDKKVVKIIDPYDGPTKPCISIRSGGMAKPESDGSCPCTSDEGCKKLGEAAYYAIFHGGNVYVFASGVQPMSGFKNCLQVGPEDIFPPIYEFKITPPQVGATVLTPFTVCAKFAIKEPPRSVTVRDAKGEHAVPIRRP